MKKKTSKHLHNEGYVILTGKKYAKCPYSQKIGNHYKVLEHRYVWWLNNPKDIILKDEVIHHKDRNRENNNIKNLVKLKVKEHSSLHWKGKLNPNYKFGIDWNNPDERRKYNREWDRKNRIKRNAQHLREYYRRKKLKESEGVLG